MPTGDFPPPPGAIWTDAYGWVMPWCPQDRGPQVTADERLNSELEAGAIPETVSGSKRASTPTPPQVHADEGRKRHNEMLIARKIGMPAQQDDGKLQEQKPTQVHADEGRIDHIAAAMFESNPAFQATGDKAPFWTWEKIADDQKNYWRALARAALNAQGREGGAPAPQPDTAARDTGLEEAQAPTTQSERDKALEEAVRMAETFRVPLPAQTSHESRERHHTASEIATAIHALRTTGEAK